MLKYNQIVIKLKPRVKHHVVIYAIYYFFIYIYKKLYLLLLCALPYNLLCCLEKDYEMIKVLLWKFPRLWIKQWKFISSRVLSCGYAYKWVVDCFVVVAMLTCLWYHVTHVEVMPAPLSCINCKSTCCS